MPKGHLTGTRASASDVSKAGAGGGSENPPVITKEAGSGTQAKGRGTGRSNKASASSGHDGVMGRRGGTKP